MHDDDGVDDQMWCRKQKGLGVKIRDDDVRGSKKGWESMSKHEVRMEMIVHPT